MAKYSTTARPDVLRDAPQYMTLTRRELMIARDAAIRRQDWHTYQTLTYVLTLQPEVRA